MLNRLHLGAFLSTAALLTGCTVNLGASGSTGTSTGTGTTNATGLPCDLADVINAKCASCHSDPPTAGAPTPLLTPADLQAPAKTNPSATMAEQSVARMQAATSPMPPAGGATSDEIAAFQNFIDSGYAGGDCASMGMPDPAFEGASVCTSNKYWPATSYGGHEQMQSGLACNTCHKAKHDGPIFVAAGTVYPTGHEPNLCYGINGGVMTDVFVRLTGADGVNHDVRPGPTGNFTYKGSLPLPYSARIVSSKGERVMSEMQTVGDCNLCHTDAAGGNNSTAAGRIVIPY